MILNKIMAIINPKRQLLDKRIEELGLSTRTDNILKRQGIATVDDLASLGWKDIAGMRKSTRATCVEVERALNRIGLGLRKDKK